MNKGEVEFNLNRNIKIELTEKGVKYLKDNNCFDKDCLDDKFYYKDQAWVIFTSFKNILGHFQTNYFKTMIILNKEDLENV